MKSSSKLGSLKPPQVFKTKTPQFEARVPKVARVTSENARGNCTHEPAPEMTEFLPKRILEKFQI